MVRIDSWGKNEKGGRGREGTKTYPSDGRDHAASPLSCLCCLCVCVMNEWSKWPSILASCRVAGPFPPRLIGLAGRSGPLLLDLTPFLTLLTRLHTPFPHTTQARRQRGTFLSRSSSQQARALHHQHHHCSNVRFAPSNSLKHKHPHPHDHGNQ